MPRWPVKGPQEEKLDSSTGITAETIAEQTKASPDLIAGFLAALQQMSADNRETTMAAMREMRKLSPEDQEKADSEKQQLMEATLRRVGAAKIQKAEIAERQDS